MSELADDSTDIFFGLFRRFVRKLCERLRADGCCNAVAVRSTDRVRTRPGGGREESVLTDRRVERRVFAEFSHCFVLLSTRTGILGLFLNPPVFTNQFHIIHVWGKKD